MAFQQARQCFPFPILGLDTDTGSEFINEAVMRYCEAEQLTFTRGRPEVKNDQCFVEQKNGAVVRQFVGADRFVGSQASRQLREFYRALRLYVNCFQPSMKLVAKQVEEGNVRRVYDPAKTPLQRLLLSGILPEATQHQLSEVAQALDPIRLLRQVEHLQQAVWRCVVTPFPLIPTSSTASLVPLLRRTLFARRVSPGRTGGCRSISALVAARRSTTREGDAGLVTDDERPL